MPKLYNLHDLLVEQTKDMYYAERLLTKAIPKMAKRAQSDDLREAFLSHLDETQNQLSRLEQIQMELGETPKGKRCPAMDGLVAEGKEMMAMEGQADVINAALIAAAQKIEHYEIASYGTLKSFAHTLGYNNVAKIFDEILREEIAADKKLTQLAESGINQEATEGVDESMRGNINARSNPTTRRSRS